MRRFGQFVDSLSENISPQKMLEWKLKTWDIVNEVKNMLLVFLLKKGSGNPSPVTAYGVLWE